MTDSRTILITGSTDGLGRRVAELLAAPGTHIIVHGRNAERGHAVTKIIEDAGGTADFMAADLGDLASVRSFAEAVRAKYPRIDILINNAGVADYNGPRRESADGLEWHMAINHLAVFLLTRLLLPTLRGDRPARIVNVVGKGQAPIDFDNVMLERRYTGRQAASQSKVAEIMFTFDLAEELADTDVTVNCLHPAAFMDTGMVRANNLPIVDSLETGAGAVTALATDKAHEDLTGAYFEKRKRARANAQCYDPAARAKMRQLSFELTGVEP